VNFFLALTISLLLLLSSVPAFSRGGGGHSGGHATGGHSTSHSSSSAHHSSTVHSSDGSNRVHTSQKAVGVARDKNGHIARSSTAREHFMKQHPCPSTGKTSGACPGYVVDHVVALKRGGKDDPSNMQWQTIQAAKIKDKTE